LVVPGANVVWRVETQTKTERRFEVDDLITRVLSGTASPFEAERLRRWRDDSPENEQHFLETLQIWALTAPEPVVPASGPPPVEAVLAAAGERPIPLRSRATHSSPTAAHPRRLTWKGWALLAASVAALALGIQVVAPTGPSPLAVYEASGDGSLTVTLGDGSFVRLAQGSRLEEWEGEGTREVSLEGRGFFAVTRDESRPFVVRTGAGRARVLGTRFELLEEGEDLRAVVVEGRVEVSNPEGSVVVGAGEVARVRDGSAPLAEAVDDIYALLSWDDGLLVFQATPLSQVAEEVARHFGRPLVVTGESLNQRRITAWFQDEPFVEVAESLCLAAGAVCSVANGGISMEAGGESGEER
jgi:transmembrane sensor